MARRVQASRVRFVRYPAARAAPAEPPPDPPADTPPDDTLVLPGAVWAVLPDGAALALP